MDVAEAAAEAPGDARATVDAGVHRLRGALAGALVVLIWSGWITLSRHGASGALTIYDMAVLRFGTAALVTAPLWPSYDWWHVRWGRALIIALGCGFPYVLLTFAGLRTTGAAGAGVIVNGSLPMASALLAVGFLRRRPRPAVWVTCAAVLVADGLMMGGGFSFAAAASARGLPFLLLAAFTLAAYMVAMEAWRFSIRDVLVLVPFINAVLLLPVWWLVLPSRLGRATLSEIAIQAGYQGIIVSVLALVSITECVKRLGSLSSSLFMALVPACTAALAWWTLGEALALPQLLGIATCSIALIHYAVSAASRPAGPAGPVR
jgi:drug/metabolite transporter (DMT)-like permease